MLFFINFMQKNAKKRYFFIFFKFHKKGFQAIMTDTFKMSEKADKIKKIHKRIKKV